MKYPKEANLCCPYCNGNGYVTVKNELIFRSSNGKSKKIRNNLRKIKEKINNMSLRDIAREVGVSHAQSVKHHMDMIDKKGGWDMEE